MIVALRSYSKLIVQTFIYFSFISYIYKKEAIKITDSPTISYYKPKSIINITNEVNELEKTIQSNKNVIVNNDTDSETDTDNEKSITNSGDFSKISANESNNHTYNSVETGHKACSFYALGKYLFALKN